VTDNFFLGDYHCSQNDILIMKKLLFAIFFVSIINAAFSQLLPLTNWNYIQIDDSHVKYGDYGNPQWLRYFGVDMMDITGDGFAEIVAGSEIYINPAANMEASWKKFRLPENVDGIFFIKTMKPSESN